ncbi:hypothetical protein [Litoribrevibacter albus]|uniref:Uncharacterized protein n=1 Tax=Litoribrevibacter albus TaxID=1473156 RepID=A0AA37SBH9_9GAMM|nr:hypothetical protein [Litoribrevibacter albus]GLQ32955.1 hypothetical protein GCM10007876_34340 [Litoribrevibacter albus]
MNKTTLLSLVILYGAATVGYADEVVGRAPDNLVGQTLGGWSGFLVGGAMAGPIGALAGGLSFAWIGGEVQAETGLSAQAYQVKDTQGEVSVVRSPNRQWQTGDHVLVKGRRLYPVSDSSLTSRSL